MSEFVRFLALVGALFCIGVYGILTRRTFAGSYVGLSVVFSSIALLVSIGNYYITPDSTTGYFFALALTVIGLLYSFLAAPFLIDELRNERERQERQPGRERIVDLLERAVSDIGSVPFQISMMVSFIAAFLLFRVTLVGFVAFVGGVISLKLILSKRMKRRRAERSAGVTLDKISATNGRHPDPMNQSSGTTPGNQRHE